jgi:hypothetical protein
MLHKNKKRIQFTTVQGSLYDNCVIYSPDNQLMCYCPRNKIDWYLKRNLAERIDDNSIRLLFEPNGLGQDIEYLLQPRENKCVVCGHETELTRHHVVGHAFRYYFPKDFLIKFGSYDILALCLDCHLKYQEPELIHTRHLFKKHKLTEKKMLFDSRKRKVLTSVMALVNNRENMPTSRIEELENVIKQYFGVDTLTAEIMDAGAQIQPNYLNPNWKDPYKEILNFYSYDDFSILWRKHFIKTMKPKFLSSSWDVDARLYRSYQKEINEITANKKQT